MSEQTFTKKANGGTFSVPLSQPFTVELPENATTGYRWQLEPKMLVVSSSYVPSADAAVGGGGLRRFTLTTTEPGAFEIRATLSRDWEHDRPPLDSCGFTVRAV